MEQLSSCYFCGTALDDPTGTYLLGGDDPSGRVTLCPTCHEKLETVFGAAGVDPGVLSDDEQRDEQATDRDEERTKREEGPTPAGTDADDILIDLGEDEALDSDADEEGDGANATGGGERSGSETPEQAVSSQKYNKVIRLLQNREFPVDRQEVITVATSAYGLRESECEQVIGRAVDRGLIDEDDEGRLVRPE